MLALALVTLFGPSLTAAVVVVLVNTPGYARIIEPNPCPEERVRHQVRRAWVPARRILRVHIMPNVIGPLLILPRWTFRSSPSRRG